MFSSWLNIIFIIQYMLNEFKFMQIIAIHSQNYCRDLAVFVERVGRD